ncbi:MAG: DUF983 domain-containing protein [Hyphomicrobiales bacterium]|jgi:uncharacterized protein (DUF983 family)|nr:MAG: DUF983 domain-containing protein [Hyphomicrobiales bacterium]
MDENYYPDISPLKTGLSGSCPRCGRGKLFDGYLTVAPRCNSCGLSYAFADGGDGAAWFVMLFVCIVGVGSILGVEVAYSPPFWGHALIAVPLLIILPMLLLRPVKGVLLCQQWKTGAREGQQAP